MPDLRDESDTEKGTRIVLELRKDADAAQTLMQLFKETDLQIALSFQMVFLFGEPMQPGRQPKQVGVVELLNYWNEHQIDVLTRRSQYDLRKAQERLHVVEGLVIGAANAEQIVRIFQQAEDRAAARKEIEARYQLTTIQSDVIASMTLAQVTRLDSSKYAREREELQVRIQDLEHLLADRKILIAALKKEMQQLIKQFSDERRTVIDVDSHVLTPIEKVESLHEREPLLIGFTRNNALKALPVETYKPKGKNGNATYTPVRGDEQLRQLAAATTQDYLLCICSSGRVCQVATHRIPVTTRSNKGELIRDLLRLAPDEEVVSVLPVDAYDEDRYLVTFSTYGKVKKSPLSEYKATDVDGIQDMKLSDGDTVATALISYGRGEYFVSTDNALTLRFSDEQLRSQGRGGQGVAAISLNKGGVVVSASYLDSEPAIEADRDIFSVTSLLVLTEGGWAKKVPLSQFVQKGRATAGAPIIELADEDRVLQTMLVQEDDAFLIAVANGKSEQAVFMKASDIKTFLRAHKGEEIAAGRILNAIKL
ncbi:DNA gyrase subunit A [Dictyobacter kobayashii]|uniref:DNA topoisomerase (ATP-hydrolyzing) n=1 Tax=Dictyobacter kobayashii TaxID=2014872 RepID=A0A402ABA2_9CHLR|nr:DNA gyrase subunit A [Dictyobacter kobayashii]GCE16398.1 hypothetical protein KDK_01980 [Dictyobacter kobayashii]